MKKIILFLLVLLLVGCSSGLYSNIGSKPSPMKRTLFYQNGLIKK